MEEVIHQSEEKYCSLVNNLNSGVYRSMVGKNGRFTQANPAEKISRYYSPRRHRDGNGIATQMEEDIKMLVITDPLTGLYNIKGFIALSEQQLKIAERADSGLLLFADLDGIKWINDHLGHAKGDETLIGVADVLKKIFREADVIARVEGDEFTVLALGASEEYSAILRNRLQKQIDSYNSLEKRDYELFLSIGIIESDSKGPVSIDDLISRADGLMYEKKG